MKTKFTVLLLTIFALASVSAKADFQTLINNKGEFYRLWENQVV